MSADVPEWWAEDLLEDWKQKLHALGFHDAEIQYSGFWSQGDGASFTATVVRELPAELVAEIEAWKVAGPAAARLTDEPWREPSYEYCAAIKRYGGGHYVHANTIYADVSMQYWDMPEDLETKLDQWASATEDALKDEARELSDELYRALETEYDYQRESLTELDEAA